MTRSNAREIAAHLIYQMDCTGQSAAQVVEARMGEEYYAGLSEENDIYKERPNKKQLEYICACVNGVEENAQALRDTISRYAIGWKVNRISRFVMAVLELALYEILFVDDVPEGTAVNEAVTLIKKYEDDEVGAFANGILGKFLRDGKQLTMPEAAAEQPTSEALEAESDEAPLDPEPAADAEEPQ
jgi:N utilization substance protein B